MKVNTKILVAPLNWGLGHATRCIPVIRELLNQSFEVIIASDGVSLELLKIEFPKLVFYDLPSYRISYDSHFVWSMAKKLPKILGAIEKEKTAVEKIVSDNGIDVIISDNRYGCHSSKAKNIFICHQHYLLLPWWMSAFSPFINALHSKYLNKFDEHWIPDLPEQSLSGKLSCTTLKDKRFIGILSRFCFKPLEKIYDIIAIVSGPEPQRTHFENILWREMEQSELKTILVCGKVESEQTIFQSRNATKVNFMSSDELERTINSSGLVICRSGYSSVMDLAKLNKRVIFIPTHGQTEQEYLAKRFRDLRVAPFFSQSQFNLPESYKISAKFSGFSMRTDSAELLQEAIKSI